MLKLKYKLIAALISLSFLALKLYAQVPVREEPMHHPVLQNKYIRLLDVWIPAGDTSLFHIHATPSLFVELSNGILGSQIKGAGWINDKAVAGKTWYRSFAHDSLVHRVCNPDSTTLHLNDIEILSSFSSNNIKHAKPLPFPLLYENERAFAYHLNSTSLSMEVIKDHGPMIVELISGSGINFISPDTKQTTPIIAGSYLYIQPGAAFYFSKPSSGDINMVLFEIK